jgi:xanthine dehydrogenase accessory factor
VIQRWSYNLAERLKRGQPVVLITQLGERGSSPRSSGAKMLVTTDATVDSLGGGNLEHQAIDYARQLLADQQDGLHEREYTLAGTLGQCCGGEVRVLFEVFNSSSQPLYLFGAGHIAQALVPLLAQLHFAVNWVDDRDELFTQPIPDGVTRIERDPIDVARDIPNDAWMLIMTHDHQLDLDLLLAAIDGGLPTYTGMIGSETKALKFRQRLAQRGISKEVIDSIHSPIGLQDLQTKLPVEIAISVAADVMTRLQKQRGDR